MSYLIVNADDLGQTPGINRGIREAYEHGIVTSASLMVDEPASEEAARICGELPGLSVGVHVKITDEYARPTVDLGAARTLAAELERQIERFRALTGCEPAHLDSHHNVHLRPDAAPRFAEVADSQALMLRARGPIAYLTSFYGQWDGETHLEQIGVEALLALIEREASAAISELGCHPGYVDAALESTYSIERETELRTLCDPLLHVRLGALDVELIGSRAARRILATTDAGG